MRKIRLSTTVLVFLSTVLLINTMALIIASIKGTLVACFFMHLLSEKKLIYAVLALTVVFFAFLIWLPVHDMIDKMGK